MDAIIKQISLGKDHALFLSNSFDVYAFGSNHYGQLGMKSKETQSHMKHPITN